MKKIQQFGVLALTLAVACPVFANEFAFERSGLGVSTGITPIGRLAWEQGLPTASYEESNEEGVKEKVTSLNADMLLRTGIAHNLELQLGWQGPSWSQVKREGKTIDEDGLGDVSIGLKSAIDLNDEKLSMAVLLETILATGNDGFTEHDDIYALATAVAYEQSELVSTDLTMRYEVQNGDWAVTAIPTIGYKIADKWSGYSELVYRKAESQDYEYSVSSGLIYALNERAQLDASVGVVLSGVDKGYESGFGFSYLF